LRSDTSATCDAALERVLAHSVLHRCCTWACVSRCCCICMAEDLSKQSQLARGTHSPSSAEQRDLSGQQRKVRRRGTLTNCRGQSPFDRFALKIGDGQINISKEFVRTAKGSQPVSGTHSLSSAERGTHHYSERMRGALSLCRGSAGDLSGQGKKADQ
jgi:hypothetical protein